jgi:galactokinase
MNFEAFFDGDTPISASAPGRVNLLGEHTDYNDGFVLPIATPMRTAVHLAPSLDDVFHFYSAELNESVRFDPNQHLVGGFGRYIEGCIRLLEQRGFPVPPLRIHVHSNVPVGAGLSSSAALEVATLRALRSMLDLPLSDIDIAKIAQRAEIDYAGVQCGIMDQMASSLCDTDHMLFLDTRSLDYQVLPLPLDTEVLVIDSGVARTLAASKYNERRAECESAARALGLSSLRDVSSASQLDRLDGTIARRARHVLSENARTERAAAGVGAAEFGALMNASHASLRDDYEVSIDALDRLCEAMRAAPGVYGARLTGAGFGGACVALCAAGTAAAAGRQALDYYNRSGIEGTLLMPQPSTAGTPTAGTPP